MTKFTPRINRAKADKIFADFVKRVNEVNADRAFLHWIAEVRAFGSYVTDTDDLGDLDLATNLERRPTWTTEKCGAMADIAEADRATSMNILGRLSYPEILLRQKIRNRSPYIALHEVRELDNNPALGGKTVYTFMPLK